MNFRLSKEQLAHLSAVGLAIDGGLRPTVFNGGFVAIDGQDEREVKSNVAQGKAHRSPAGSRAGRRAPSRPRAQAARHHFRSDALEGAFGVGFRLLAQHYEALASEDDNGLWVAVACYPLGSAGPQVHFLTGFPSNPAIAPRAWAFDRLGTNASLVSLKHTNFPDASICAFTDEDAAWPNPDGMLGLIDIFSIWMIKKWHHEVFGWWPGRQAGACALYRRLEFAPDEQCGCLSGLRYRDCHKDADTLVHEGYARGQFRKLFGCDYEDRQAPPMVLKAAMSRWRSVPPMTSVFMYRLRDTEPLMG